MAKRAIVVGAGRRAHQTIFPALHALRDRIELVGAYARRPRDLKLLGGALRVPVRAGLGSVDLSEVDLALVAVPTREVPGVLRSLVALDPRRTTLMLDTPILEPQDVGAAQLFPAFREVLASEESVALPQLLLARRLLRSGSLGRLRKVHLFHSGYRHHAMASLRSLAGAPRWIRVKRWNRSWAEVSVGFAGGTRATIVEPRRYDSGRFAVVGERGAVVDYPLGDKAAEIAYRIEDGVFVGLTLDGAPVERSELDDAYLDLARRATPSDAPLIAMLKVRALMELLAALDDPGSELRYDPFDAMLDSLSLRVAERLGSFVDLPAAGSTAASRTLRLASRLIGPGRPAVAAPSPVADRLAAGGVRPRAAATFEDARRRPSGSVVECDICVVGTGPAGATLVRELAKASADVLVLEAGGLVPDPETSSSRETESEALEVPAHSRDRYLGGTRWWGKVSTLDEIDLRVRPWVPLSGWPIDAADLRAYFRRAEPLLRAPDLDALDLAALPGTGIELAGGPLAAAPLYWRRPAPDFAELYARSIRGSGTVSTMLHANVTEILLTEDGARVERLKVRTLNDRHFEVRPRLVVLACGAIEAARVLLASSERSRRGVGNEHDQVGRYFMEHPKGIAGMVRRRRDAPLPHRAYVAPVRVDGGRVQLGLRLSDRAQEEREVLNGYVLLNAVYGDADGAGADALRRLARRPGAVLGDPSLRRELVRSGKPLAALAAARAVGGRGISAFRVENFMEQQPRAENRVTLGEARDAFGLPVARVSWSISEFERRTMRALHTVLGEELRRRSIGELDSPLLGGEDGWPIEKDASHHMGTTRMGTDPRTSVVDPDCRVHGVENLYVAGSAVFPTSGYANPTLTIMALALRLADRLRAAR